MSSGAIRSECRADFTVGQEPRRERPCAALTKAATCARSFRPGADSTPLATSTIQGRTRGDPRRDVLGRQAAGQDQPGQGGHRVEDVVGDGRAGAARLARRRRRRSGPRPAGARAPRARLEVFAHPAPARRPIQPKRSDDLELTRARAGLPAARVRAAGRSSARARAASSATSAAGRSTKTPTAATDAGRAATISAARSGVHVSRRARMKVEADPVDTQLGAGQRVVDARQTADLHADHGDGALARCTSGQRDTESASRVHGDRLRRRRSLSQRLP